MTSELDELLRIRRISSILASVRSWLLTESYDEIVVPELVTSTGACEALDMFYVDVFGKLAFLRQTGQLYLEELVSQGMERVYCEGSSFRKEPNSGDGRHLCEFRLVEIEEANMDLTALVAASVNLLRHVVYSLDSELFGERRISRLRTELEGDFPVLTYREALAILQRSGNSLAFGDDIDRVREQFLVQHCGKAGVAIVRHPTPLKFFNMKITADDSSVVDSCDLILRDGGEAFGGAVRETDSDSMRQRLHSQPMYGYLIGRAAPFAAEAARANNWSSDEQQAKAGSVAEAIEESFEAYFDLIAAHPVSRGGFGLGVARLTQYILGCETIDEAVHFPVTRLTLR